MLGQSLKKIFKIIIIFIVLSFGYALGAILFKWYPFELVKNAMIQSTINKYEIKSKLFNFSFKNNQAIIAVVGGIKKNIETVLLAELFLIKNIKIVNAPKDTRNI